MQEIFHKRLLACSILQSNLYKHGVILVKIDIDYNKTSYPKFVIMTHEHCEYAIGKTLVFSLTQRNSRRHYRHDNYQLPNGMQMHFF